MKQILSLDDCDTFVMRRYLVPGGQVVIAPRVSRIVLKPLEVNNLKYNAVDSVRSQGAINSTSVLCSIHKDCLGHLECSRSHRVGLPPKYMTLDTTTPNRETILTENLYSGQISNLEYALTLRNMISGKRGHMKFHLLGCQPSTSMRGVASCSWSCNPSHVFVPMQWIKNSVVVYQSVSEVDGSKSTTFSSRSVNDGDYAILSRAPAISDKSVQPVRIYGWNNPSVGVHPEMCKPLNLDYDGDEVHLLVMSSTSSVNELRALIETSKLGSFDPKHLRNIIQETLCTNNNGDGSNNDIDDYLHSDFMVYSTRSITQANQSAIITDFDVLCGCTQGAWDKLSNDLSVGGLDYESYYQNSVTAVEHLTRSHITVSDGFTFGRQLKHAAQQIYHSSSNTKPLYSPIQSQRIAKVVSISKQLRNTYGYPAVRLAMKIATKCMQSILDIAKGKKSSYNSSFVASMFYDTTRDNVDYKSYSHKHHLVFITNSRRRISSIDDSTERYLTCIRSLEYGCKLAKVQYSDVELLELAYLVFVSSFDNPIRAISSISGVKYLTSTNIPLFEAALADDLFSLDAIPNDSCQHISRRTSTVINPSTAIAIGNFTSVLSRSTLSYI